MPDFTINTYKLLLEALKNQDYQFQTFEQYLNHPATKSIVIRHDVDARPQNSLQLAIIEAQLNIKGTYNFRAKPQSWDEEIIKEIAKQGHEIGYHYEDLATHKGDHEKAIEGFKQNLNKLRKIAKVSTICMHGSPTSKHDSRDLWKTNNYKDLKLKGEPYFDVDYTQVLYLTDTGRRWDGHKVSIRDKVDMRQNEMLTQKGHYIKKTRDIIKAANEKALPDQIMFTIHPQRWHSGKNLPNWVIELVTQNLKNLIKAALLRTKRSKRSN